MNNSFTMVLPLNVDCDISCVKYMAMQQQPKEIQPRSAITSSDQPAEFVCVSSLSRGGVKSPPLLFDPRSR